MVGGTSKIKVAESFQAYPFQSTDFLLHCASFGVVIILSVFKSIKCKIQIYSSFMKFIGLRLVIRDVGKSGR
jgi:hypothetical protein